MSEEEQVVGVMKQCGVCEGKTLHVDGVCREHRGIARVSAVPPPLPTTPTVGTTGIVREGRHIKVPILTVLLLGVLVAVVGDVHVVHGGGAGLHVCQKDGWSLGDTFVDLDDYIGKPLIQNIDKAKVLRAMFSCGMLERPHFGEHRSTSDDDDAGAALERHRQERERERRDEAARAVDPNDVMKTNREAKELAAAAPQWIKAHPDQKCPTNPRDLAILVEGGEAQDAWGGWFRVGCDDNGVFVQSPGPDSLYGTDDDIVARTK